MSVLLIFFFSFCPVKHSLHSWEGTHITLSSQIPYRDVLAFSTSICPLNVPMLPLATVYSSCLVVLFIYVTSGTVASVGEHLFLCNSTPLLFVWLEWHFCQLSDGFYSKWLSTQFNPSTHWKETSWTLLKYMTQGKNFTLLLRFVLPNHN